MDISNITNAVQSSSGTSTETPQTLGKDDFLKLLTAQLKAQDPLNPMDGTNFVAQLAQFSSLEQLTNINSQLTTMAASQASMQNTIATDLIGKSVTFEGNTVTLNGSANINYALQGDASKVTVSIYNSSGSLVKTAVLGSEIAGNNSYLWDGTDSNGNQLAADKYTFKVAAEDSTGKMVTATPLTAGTVTGITFNNNVTYLTVDGALQVQLGDIQTITGGI